MVSDLESHGIISLIVTHHAVERFSVFEQEDYGQDGTLDCRPDHNQILGLVRLFLESFYKRLMRSI